MWTRITSGFDVEDETANFGTRAVAESEVAVFETNTLATIQAENKDALGLKPSVHAEYYLELGTCLFIENTVTLFNENCSQTLLCLTFDTIIDTVCILGNGKFILIGLKNGELHFYHILTETRIFTRPFKEIPNSTKTFVKIYCCGEGETLEIFISTAMGQIQRITNLKLEELETACTNKDSSSVEEIAQSIVIREWFSNSDFKFKVGSACRFNEPADEANSFLLLGKDMYLRSGDDDDNLIKICPLPEEMKLKKVEITQNKSLCVGLTETGKIVFLCMHTLVPISVWEGHYILDFTLLDGSAFDAENNLLVITGGEECYMLLVSWPGFQVKFKLKVQSFSQLVYQQNSSDDILYVEGFGEEKIDTIRLKAIVESQPEFRLQRILRKKRFEEAEKFALTFNLNIELVYKAQVQQLMQDLQPWNNNPESVKVAFDMFMALLDKIIDIEFLCECCVNAIPPDFTTTKMLLEYGENRLSKLPAKSETYVRSELLQKIFFISQRLDTFQQIHGHSANSENWLHFLKADLFKECQKHLKRGEIQESIFIWSRHLYEIKAKLDWTQVLVLLEDTIPTWVKSKDMTLWLNHFVPPILSLHPDIPEHILQWTVGKIKTLEVLERESWPEVGLDLANNVLRMLDPLLALQENALLNNCTPKSPVNKLLAFIKNLRDIQTLKNNYGVVISCIDFLQLNDQELIILILARTSTEKISRLVIDFLKKIMLERNLVCNNVISNFIQEMVDSSVDWSQWDETHWEMSVAALIPCIDDIQERLECILKVLRMAPVPWSNLVESIAIDALKLNHPLTKDVQECVNILPQKLIYKKYGFKKNVPQNDVNIILMIKHIFKKDRATVLEDVLKLVESSADKTYTYQIILKNLIEKGKYVAAMELLAGLDSEEELSCNDYIMCAAEQYLRLGSLEELKCYIEILPITCTQNEFVQFKKYYNLKMDKNMDFSFQEFWYHSAKNKRLSNHTAIILKGLLEKQLTEEEVVIKIPYYARLLDISCEEWILSIATQAVECNFGLAYSLASNIEELPLLYDDGYSKVNTLAVCLFAHYKPEEDLVAAEDLVELICKLATQCLLHCSSNYISKASDMLGWFGLLKSSIREHRNVFNHIYTDPIPSTTTVISLHSNVQNMLHHYISAWRDSSTKLDSQVLEAFENATKNNLLEKNIVPKLPAIFGQLRNEQQYLTGISLLTSFYWSLCSIAVPFEAENIELILNQSSFEVLKKLTNSRHFDLSLALGFLQHFETDEALAKLGEIEKSVSLNYTRLSSLTLLGLAYCEMNNIDTNWKYFKKKYTQCMWAKKLSELGIPYKEAFKERDSDQQIQLLMKLMKTPGVTLDLLKEYCLSMQVDLQDCLTFYLKEILLSWEPAIEFKSNNSNKKEMVVTQSMDDLKKQSMDIINSTNSETKQLIKDDLLSLWRRVNCYYYEVFIVIIELLEYLSQGPNEEFTNYRLLLGFLRTYIRIGEPQSDEKELDTLPPIAEFRLPFTLLNADPWKIIKPELNLASYKMWFDVINILRLDKNTLCSLTINRLTTNQLSAGKTTDDHSGWCVDLKNKSLLAEIKECVGNITNLEMASASLYYVVTHMPPGADQVAAAEMCYLEALKWVSLENSDKALKGLAKVEKKFLTVSTSHILYSHQLGQQKYLQLVLNPDDLICELYRDPSILIRKSGCTTHLPDINGAVDAIGTLNSKDLKNIRFEILNDWLQSSNVNLDTSLDDVTSNITVAMFHHRNDNSSIVENENIIRACYLLESMDTIKAAEYLSGLSFGSDDVEYRNILVKLRALQCLCAIASKETIEQVTGRTLAFIRKHMQALLFEHELEKLGLSWSPNKSEIVRVLLKRSNPHALRLAAAMCKEFNLNIPEYWDSILSRMVAIEMVDTLCQVLPDLTPQSHIINKDVFKNAWNCVILTPLLQATHPLNEEGRRKIEKSIEMWHKCPIPFKIDKASVIAQCQRLQAEDLLVQLGHL